jgi:hypothetical protein
MARIEASSAIKLKEKYCVKRWAVGCINILVCITQYA